MPKNKNPEARWVRLKYPIILTTQCVNLSSILESETTISRKNHLRQEHLSGRRRLPQRLEARAIEDWKFRSQEHIILCLSIMTYLTRCLRLTKQRVDLTSERSKDSKTTRTNLFPFTTLEVSGVWKTGSTRKISWVEWALHWLTTRFTIDDGQTNSRLMLYDIWFCHKLN